MIKYLISYWTGARVRSLTIELPADYKPAKDNCKLIKKAIIEEYHPHEEEWMASGMGTNYVRLKECMGKFCVDNLQLVAVCNLEACTMERY